MDEKVRIISKAIKLLEHMGPKDRKKMIGAIDTEISKLDAQIGFKESANKWNNL